MFWRTVGRLILVPVAFLIAACAALFVLFTLGQERLTQDLHNVGPTEAVDVWFRLAEKAAALFSGLTIIPAIAVVIIGEVARVRSWIYYLVGGGVALAAIPLLAHFAQGVAAGGALPTTLLQVFATAGFAGGFVYWLIAGRSA